MPVSKNLKALIDAHDPNLVMANYSNDASSGFYNSFTKRWSDTQLNMETL
jgi:hypothetical protein